MKKAALVVSKPYQGNRIFNRDDSRLNRDDCLAPFFFLKKDFEKMGVDLSTQDINSVEESDYVLYNDMPKKLPRENDTSKSFLLILESPLIVKNSWDRNRFNSFKKVFSWNDDVLNDDKFIKINYSFDIPKLENIEKERSRFCCLISAHKKSLDQGELYSERIKAIRWFEENSPESFDLFGIGWDKPAYVGVFKIIKKVPGLISVMPFKEFPSYKGMVDSKRDVLSQYNFSICYENIKDLNGYITEKIFDCFFAGTIPVYLGASNIGDYVPRNCFIDQSEYSSYESLFKFLKSLSEREIANYRKNIQAFLESEEIQKFSVREFSRIVSENILESK